MGFLKFNKNKYLLITYYKKRFIAIAYAIKRNIHPQLLNYKLFTQHLVTYELIVKKSPFFNYYYNVCNFVKFIYQPYLNSHTKFEQNWITNLISTILPKQ